jgi:hypothetical protein
VSFLSDLVLLVEGPCPETVPDRFIGVFDEALMNKERPGGAPGGRAAQKVERVVLNALAKDAVLPPDILAPSAVRLPSS